MHLQKIILIFIFAYLNLAKNEIPSIFSALVDIDYLPATQAFNDAKEISEKYQHFKEKIAKNITIEYQKCVDMIKESKCNNIDQWQSVIEELKLQIQNSKEIEAPFLEARKAQKVERLKELMNVGEAENNQFSGIQAQLLNYQAFLEDNAKMIEIMYKLPKQEEMAAFAQQIDVTDQLISNVPDVAQDELKKTAQNYEIGDISIQAQATMNVMQSTLNHVKETFGTVIETYDLAAKDQLEEKQKLKDNIESLRALIANEQWVQAESQSKINDFEGKIAACNGMPTNIEKDCEPLKLKQKKKNTEIDVMHARTMILFKELQQLMEENEPESDIQAHVDSTVTQQEAEFKATIEQSYVKEEKPSEISTKAPEELKPIHHMREQVMPQDAPQA